MTPTPTGQQQYVFVPYTYVVTGATLGSGASGLTPLLFDEDADFELHVIVGTTDADAATDFRPNRFSVQFTDKNSSRLWSNARIQQISLWPQYELRRPVVVSRRTNLNCDFLNLTTNNMTPTVMLHGFKVLGM